MSYPSCAFFRFPSFTLVSHLPFLFSPCSNLAGSRTFPEKQSLPTPSAI
jgi:hypothetical protein